MGRYYFSRTDTRTLLKVARSSRQTSNKNQGLEYPQPGGIIPKKLLVRFTLNASLATSDASKAGTITAQYHRGRNANTSTAITVHNVETNSAGTYVFSGDSGDAGLAIWDSGLNYRIIQMECP